MAELCQARFIATTLPLAAPVQYSHQLCIIGRR
jgi:hypothetical protein